MPDCLSRQASTPAVDATLGLTRMELLVRSHYAGCARGGGGVGDLNSNNSRIAGIFLCFYVIVEDLRRRCVFGPLAFSHDETLVTFDSKYSREGLPRRGIRLTEAKCG